MNIERPGFDVVETARLLRRYQAIHRSVLRSLAGWFLAAPAYEVKHTFGYHLWDHAQHVREIRTRLHELRGGHPDANIEPSLTFVLDEALHARDTPEFVSGTYISLIAALLEQYRTHLKLACPSANAPEVQMLRRIASDLEAHLEWAETYLASVGVRPQDVAWRTYISRILDDAGGVAGNVEHGPGGSAAMNHSGRDDFARPHHHRFSRPRTIFVDDRLKRGGLMSFEDRQNLDYEAELIEQFKVYFNELYAAGMLASILYDAAGTDVPFDFLYDVAHQCWDEARHSEFGLLRLSELGVQPEAFDPSIYEQTESLPFLHRFLHLTLSLEVHFMARKRPRVLQYEAHNDERSKVFADIDWSDEINHVGYGKRWSKYFLADDARTPEDILNEVAEHIQKIKSVSDKEAAVKPPF